MNPGRMLQQVALVLASVGLCACGSSSDELTEGGSVPAPGGCAPQATSSCACADGTMGTQLCSSDGTSFTPCQCGGSSVPVAPGAEGAVPTGSDPSSPASDPTSPTSDPTSVQDPAQTTPEIQAYDELYRCNIQTSWLGDEVCIAAPDPSEGFQLHYGPSDYDNPDDVAWFILGPGGESNDEVPVTTGNATDIVYQEYHIRLRPGTHHMILWANDVSSGVSFGRGRYLFGAQGALGDSGGGRDRPPPEGLAPENEGVGFTLGANTPIAFNMHYVNTRDEPILREGWVNFHYADPADVTEIADPITFWGALGLRVPAQSGATDGASCGAPPTGEVRVLGLSGHMHAHGTRFTVWHNSPAGRNLVYETYDWSEPSQLAYDSIHNNPAPDPSQYLDGGHSGILTVNPGDSLEYECEWLNDTNIDLTFGNQTYEAEMCLLFGTYAPSMGGPWSCVSP